MSADATHETRPVTALVQPIEGAVSPPPGFWQRDASHMPNPLSPMYRSFLPVAAESFRRMFDRFGFLVETVASVEIGGWGYVRLVPLGGRDRKAPPPVVFAVLCRLVPSIRRRVRRCVAAVRQDVAGSLVEQWYDEWQPQMRDRGSRLRPADLGGLGDQALADHFRAAVELHEQGNEIHFLLQGALYLILGEFAFCCRDLLGWDEEKTFALLAGLSATSTAPARELAELARLLEEAGEETDEGFVVALLRYSREYGCRALSLEVAEPTLAELPSLTMALIKDQLARGGAGWAAPHQRRAAMRAEACAAAARLSASDCARFERLLRRAERAYPVREDNEFYTISVPLALVRYAAGLTPAEAVAAGGA